MHRNRRNHGSNGDRCKSNRSSEASHFDSSGGFLRKTRVRSHSFGRSKRYGGTHKECRSFRSSSRRRLSCCFFCLSWDRKLSGKRRCSGLQRSSGNHCSTVRRCHCSRNRGSKTASSCTARSFCLGANCSRSWANHRGRHTCSRSMSLWWSRPSEWSRPYEGSDSSGRFVPGQWRADCRSGGLDSESTVGGTSCQNFGCLSVRTTHCTWAWRCRWQTACSSRSGRTSCQQGHLARA